MRVPSRAAKFTAFVSGQVAGLAMLLVAMALSAASGASPLRPLQVMTALLVGEQSLRDAGAASLLPGLLAHFSGPTVLWSKVYGLIVGLMLRKLSGASCILLGLAVGVFAMLVDVFVLMPGVQHQINGENLWAQNVPVWAAWVEHGVFGLVLGALYFRWQPEPPR